jgi:hypothetical protein
MATFVLEIVDAAPGTLPPIAVVCTDPHAAFARTSDGLCVTTDDPDAKLVEIWPANGPSGWREPMAVVSDLTTGWTTATFEPNQIHAYLQFARCVADARDSYREVSEFVPSLKALDLIDADEEPDFNALRRFLRDNPDIRRRRPKSAKTGQEVRNRQLVHAGDMISTLERQWKALRQHLAERQARQDEDEVKRAVAQVAAERPHAEEVRRGHR